MDGRVQGLDAAAEHLRPLGDIGHIDDVDAGLAQGSGRAASGQHRHPELVQGLGLGRERVDVRRWSGKMLVDLRGNGPQW